MSRLTELFAPLRTADVALEVHGRDELGLRPGPVVLVANHPSPVDAHIVLSTLPRGWRKRTVVPRALTPDAGRRVLAEGSHLLCFPEGEPSPDGYLRPFDSTPVEVAAASGVPVVPIGIRGTYAAFPPGRVRTGKGRRRVVVRYGLPLHHRGEESVREFGSRAEQAVQDLVDEDATSWWHVRSRGPSRPHPPSANWRRIWEQSEEPVAGGRAQRTSIWRS